MIAPILAVKDVDASLAFYIEKLGFEKVFVMQGPDGKSTFAYVSIGYLGQIGLDARQAAAPLGSGVVFMIYPPEEVDLDKLYADVQSRGVAIAKPLRDEYWGDRTFSVKDPDGYCLTFSVTEANEPAGQFADIMKNFAQS
jgi:PhnB protein